MTMSSMPKPAVIPSTTPIPTTSGIPEYRPHIRTVINNVQKL